MLMTVMTQPRENWTDERLDDLQGEMHRGFADQKSESATTRSDLKAEIAATRSDLKAEIAATRSELRAEIATTRSELKVEIVDTKAEMRAGFARIDMDMRGLRSEMNARFEAANRNLIAVTVAIIAAVIGSNVFF
jgi:hypothetical protein